MNWPGAPGPPMGGGAPTPDPRLQAWLAQRGVTPQFVPAYEYVKNMVWGPHPTPPFSPAQVDQVVAAWAHHAPPQQLQTLRDMGYLLLHFFHEQQVGAGPEAAPAPPPVPSQVPAPGDMPNPETISRMMSMAGGLDTATLGSVVGIDGSEALDEDEEEEEEEDEEEGEEEEEEEDEDDDEFAMDGVEDAAKPVAVRVPPNRPSVDATGGGDHEELSVDWRAARPDAPKPAIRAQDSAPLPQVAVASGLAIGSGVRPAVTHGREPSRPSKWGDAPVPDQPKSKLGLIIAGLLALVAAGVGVKYSGILHSEVHIDFDNPDATAVALLDDSETQEGEAFLLAEDTSLFEWGYETEPLDFVVAVYDHGAPDVRVAGIEKVGKTRVAALFVITLPEDPAEREALIAWCDEDFPGLCKNGRDYVIAATD